MEAVKLNRNTSTLGFIGLGLMGSRLAQRLHSAGWRLQAWNRSAEAAREVSQSGIPIAKSLDALIDASEVILSCLANDAAVRSVYLGDKGVLAVAKPGTIVLEMSTIS